MNGFQICFGENVPAAALTLTPIREHFGVVAEGVEKENASVEAKEAERKRKAATLEQLLRFKRERGGFMIDIDHENWPVFPETDSLLGLVLLRCSRAPPA